MDGLPAAAETLIRDSCNDLRAAIAGLDRETLAREPAPDTSPLVVLVQHSVSATRELLGAAASGRINRQQYRDERRTPSFEHRRATEQELAALLDGLEAEAARLLARIPMDRLGDDVVLEGPAPGDPATRAWMLLRAVEHLREHAGHAQLTRQVLLGTGG